jgi:excisionase family DNA binding protein
MTDGAGTLSLKECAARLDVHYMTAYRYVRTGMLPAVKEGSEWRVATADLEAFIAGQRAHRPRGNAPWKDRLKSRMIAGDERGSWIVVESALSSGLTPERVYLELLGPALREIGTAWHDRTVTVAEEHRASAVAYRLIGRMGSRFNSRGRPKGRFVIGAPPGERHALGAAMVADMMRSAGFDAVDLGADTPVESFVEASRETVPLAVGISVTAPSSLRSAALVAAEIRSATATPVLLGGPAVRDAVHAAELGADGYGADGRDAVAWVEDLAT